ncbi:MAG: NfeD family protein [Acidimicrobiia bacterium]
MAAGSDAWQWFWLAAVVILALSEIITPFLFFMISFALGAALAAVAAFLGAALVVQWTLFVVGSGVSLGLLAPLGRRMAREASDDDHEGAMRWVGRLAVVIEPILPTELSGLVRRRRGARRDAARRRPSEAGRDSGAVGLTPRPQPARRFHHLAAGTA